MRKKSTSASSLSIIQGGKADTAKSVASITHKDVKEFLARFAEAILVDQKRVRKLPREELHPLYDPSLWNRSREEHVGAIVQLSMTVDRMSLRLLKKLTQLAVGYKPESVTRSLLNIISDLAAGAASPWLYETATLFFNELIKDVRRRDPDAPRSDGCPIDMMSKWFDYDDPIQIARDAECEYVDLLALHIERESQKTRQELGVQSRLAYIEMRVAYEFSEYLLLCRRND